jgi:hypothetical protein
MKIGITLDGVISGLQLEAEGIDNDLYCLNQLATEQGWYASSRWFAAGHDVFFITSRTNQEMTNRWLDEWALMYNRVIYDIPIHYHYNTAVALECDIFITGSWDELPKHGTHEVRTYFYYQEPVGMKTPDKIYKVSNLNDIDEVIASWPLHPKQSNVKIVGQSRTLRT